MLRPLPVRHYLDVMKSKGFPVQDVLAGTRIDVAEIESPGFLIDFDQYRRVVENMVALDGDQGLGLDVSLESDIGWFGVVGHAALCCSTARECLEQLRTPFGEALGFMSGFKLENGTGKTLIFKVVTPSSNEPVHRFCVEEALGTLLKIGGQMTGAPPTFEEVRLDYPAPSYRGRYEQIFRCPVTFEASDAQVTLRRDWVDLPLPRRDEEMSQFYRQHLIELIRKIKNSSPIKSRVREILVRRCQSMPTLEQVAHELGMTPRTLSRHLQQQGDSYRAIVEEVRVSLAKEYIRLGRFPPKMIGETLGFQDVQAFRRAFKAWTGQTIRQFRSVA